MASDGGTILTSAVFEWSKDFGKKNEAVQKRIVPLSYNGKRIDFNNETFFDIQLTDEQVRMDVSNSVGTSDKSDPFSLKEGKIKPQYLVPEKVKSKRICTIWIVVLVLVVLLVIALLAFIVYKTRQSQQATAATSTNNEERKTFIVN